LTDEDELFIERLKASVVNEHRFSTYFEQRRAYYAEEGRLHRKVTRCRDLIMYGTLLNVLLMVLSAPLGFVAILLTAAAAVVYMFLAIVRLSFWERKLLAHQKEGAPNNARPDPRPAVRAREQGEP
jgi:hypothetical protein